MTASARLLGIVLCGGKSSRMGRDKAGMDCPGRERLTFFDVATQRLLGHCQKVAISGHCSVDHPFDVIEDRVADQGPMQGVLSSLEYAREQNLQGCLVTPIDVPNLTGRDLSLLIQAWNQSPRLTVAFSNRLEPLIAIYPVACIDSLADCIQQSRLSLAGFIQDLSVNTVSLPTVSCRNFNRPSDMPSTHFAFEHPDDALRAIAAQLRSTPTESATLKSVGRVLAEKIFADRDSPAADVSAMDGFAVRMTDLNLSGSIPIVGESACGRPAPPMPDAGVLKIFTGAIVPEGCDAVIKREDTIETDQTIQWTDRARAIDFGANIRRSGENLAAGEAVLDRGVILTPANLAAMVNFGCVSPQVFGRVNVSVLTTGDEVIDGEQPPQPWQLRNSNLHALMALFAQRPWIDVQSGQHCGDDRAELVSRLKQSLEQSDLVVLTGGVSMGDYDFVPDVVQEVGGQVIFHKLPIRPGKPILGAVTKDGKLIVGLPGNPVSAVVNARRMVIPLIAKISGQTRWLPDPVKIRVNGFHNKPLPLHQCVLVSINSSGQAQVVPSKGSGDLVALANSDGFVEIPANDIRNEPRNFYAW